MLVASFNGLYCTLHILHVFQDQLATSMNTQQIINFSNQVIPCSGELPFSILLYVNVVFQLTHTYNTHPENT